MKIRILFLVLLMASAVTSKPVGGLKKIATIYVTADYITTDNLGYIYVVKRDELRKYNPADNSFESYSTKNSGNISYVDASNSMKVLLYYKDFTQIVFLDNRLGITGSPILFQDINLQQTTLACSSHNNGIIVYNTRDFEWSRLDEKLETSFKTGNITQLTHQAINPSYLLQYTNDIYLSNPLTGILVFDLYGAYIKTIPVKDINYFQVGGDNLYYLQNNKLFAYNLKTITTEEIVLPEAGVKSFRVEKNKLYLQTESAVVTYLIE